MRCSSERGRDVRQISLKAVSIVIISINAVTATKPMPTAVNWGAFSENCAAYVVIDATDSGTILLNKKRCKCTISDSNTGKAETIVSATVMMGTSASSVVNVR